ncbi:MAG: hypothetical protein LQ337_002790 [Flavoplaca oasis]|nr:MAG: hypothetical protein LQ337_002790 [Flavoplaca oasis]
MQERFQFAPKTPKTAKKALSIPILNPLNVYGRVFLLSWWGFFVAFCSWYAFPPLLTETLKKDLNLSQAEVANSNILGLTAALIVRLVAGLACDRFGARWTFAGILLLGAIPTALAGTVTTHNGLVVLRFFAGILGGSFIPCQVWTTGFFDKSVVGTANALTAGLGNAGSGVTYFLMPAIFNSLVQRQGLSESKAWRVAFVVPFILITATAIVMILTCPDTPTGRWSSRNRDIQRHLDMRDTFLTTNTMGNKHGNASSIDSGNDTVQLNSSNAHGHFTDTQTQEDDLLTAASWELVEKPTVKNSLGALCTLPTLTLLVVYFCSFGTELSVNSILGAYYAKNFPDLGQTGSGSWAAMFGLLNAVFRPAGGILADLIYRHTNSLWAKKALIHSLGIMLGVFLILIGIDDPNSKPVMFGLMTGMAFFDEAANGACFALVPHVRPTSNGLITGVTGAAGNLGGIVFLLIGRFTNGSADYPKKLWIIGAITIAGNLLVAWIRPIPKSQLGGR